MLYGAQSTCIMGCYPASFCLSQSALMELFPPSQKPLQGVFLNISGECYDGEYLFRLAHDSRGDASLLVLCESYYSEITLQTLSLSLYSLLFSTRLFLVAGLGAWQRQRCCHGNDATELPGQRPCGICDGSEEVHRVLHLCAVFHHAGGRPPQPAPGGEDTRGQ